MWLPIKALLSLSAIAVILGAPTDPTNSLLQEEDTTNLSVAPVDAQETLDRDTTGTPLVSEFEPAFGFLDAADELEHQGESRSIAGSEKQDQRPENVIVATSPATQPSSDSFSPMFPANELGMSTRGSLFSLAGIGQAAEAESAEEEEGNDSAHYEDYDYKVGGLPPSLPNLEIIPFVAADAVVQSGSVQGIDGDRESAAAPVVPVPPVVPAAAESRGRPMQKLETSAPEKQDDLSPAEKRNDFEPSDGGCAQNGTKYQNGEMISKKTPCSSCRCEFGDVVCQDTKCPPVPRNCSIKPKPNNCCGVVVCESGITYATDILDRPPTFLRPIGIPIPSLEPRPTIPSEKIGAVNPFRNVIKFQPAPNLEGDEESKKNAFYVFSNTQKPDNPVLPVRKNLALPKVQSNKKHSLPKNSLPPVRNEVVPSAFKLGGCNIYGRMYKVGKVVDELSGPCTLCKCADNGVQCNPLPC